MKTKDIAVTVLLRLVKRVIPSASSGTPERRRHRRPPSRATLSKASSYGFGLLVALCLGGCASTQSIPMDPAELQQARREFAETALNDWQFQARRLQAVSDRLFTKAAKHCKTTETTLGLMIEERTQIPERILAELDDEGQGLPAVSVFLADPDDPTKAPQAIRAIEGIAISAPETSESLVRQLALRDSAGVDLQDGERREQRAQLRCSARVEMAEDSALFAYYNGFRIVVSFGMVQALNDNQLAQVVAHELGHRELGHVNQLVLRGIAGAALGAPVGAPGTGALLSTRLMRSPYEVDADRFAVAAISDAGFDVQDASTVFKAVAQRSPYAVGRDFWRTHPRLADREVQMKTSLAGAICSQSKKAGDGTTRDCDSIHGD